MTQEAARQTPFVRPDPEGLLVALVLAPATFSRNRFFDMFQEEELRTARRRAQIVRSIIKDLTEPWPHPGEFPSHPKPHIEEEVERDGCLHLTYRVDAFDFRRSAILSPVEAAALRYALHRAGLRGLSTEDRRVVDTHLGKMNPLEEA
jgi:hypothetical protein